MEDTPLGEVKVKCNELQVEWKIPDFLSVPVDKDYNSQVFNFVDSDWYIKLHSDDDRTFTRGLIVLYVMRADEGPTKTLHCTFGVKEADGKVKLMDSYMQFFGKETQSVWQRFFFSKSGLQQRKSLFMPSGILTITCHLKYEIPDGIEVAGSGDKFKTLEILSQNLRDLFMNGTNCDTTFEVQDKKFEAHRSILIARSSVFAAMFHNDMTEKQSGVISIPDCDPDSFRDFLLFLYSGKAENLTFCNALHLFKTADKYDVQELKSLCLTYMQQNLEAKYVCDAIALANQYNETELQSVTQDFFNKNMAEVLATSEWKTLIQSNYPLVEGLLTNLALKIKNKDN